MEINDLLSYCQQGLRRERSAGDLLVYVTHCWPEAIEKHGEALTLSLDISKVFDSICPTSLLSKLPAYVILADFCSWRLDFLTERSIRIVIEVCSSDLMAVDAGVSQKSATHQ